MHRRAGRAVADVVVLLQGQGAQPAGGRASNSVRISSWRGRSCARDAAPRQRPACRGRGGHRPVVTAVRSRTEGRLRHSGRDRARHRQPASTDAWPGPAALRHRLAHLRSVPERTSAGGATGAGRSGKEAPICSGRSSRAIRSSPQHMRASRRHTPNCPWSITRRAFRTSDGAAAHALRGARRRGTRSAAGRGARRLGPDVLA